MKIQKFRFAQMRNAEHFQFMTEFKDLVILLTAVLLNIVKMFEYFLVLYNKADVCLIQLRKSLHTEELGELDRQRDNIFRALKHRIQSYLGHFNAGKVAAAKRLLIVLNTYGNLADKPNDEETAGIYNLVADLEGKYAEDVDALDSMEWVEELKTKNLAYDKLVKSRDTEKSDKPTDKIVDVRAEMDSMLNLMTATIAFYYKVETDPTKKELFESAILKYNVIAKRYADRLAQREGFREAQKDEPIADADDLVADGEYLDDEAVDN